MNQLQRTVNLVLIASVALMLAACGYTKPDDFSVKSAALSRFWHHPVSVRAQVLLPASYASSPQQRYPVIYWIHGFGGTYKIGRTAERDWRAAMTKAHVEAILVFLDAAWNGGHHEFADSANNGPWGTALVTEFIPAFERQYRTLPTKRFLVGHSSGGWSALWLQVRYPTAFAGAWAIAPDPVDFHDFTGPDLTRTPAQNFYVDRRGNDYGFLRRHGHDVTTLRGFIQYVPGAAAQYDSFDAVFSPRGKNGMPQPLFNRDSGRIDPRVAQYWESHYDITELLREHWLHLAPELNGKLHVIVGTQDTYHLDHPVRLLAAELHTLHANAEITFVPGANHQSVLKNGDVLDHSVAEMH